MICDRCNEDRLILYNLHALGCEEEVCETCCTNDEWDWIAERNRKVPQDADPD